MIKAVAFDLIGVFLRENDTELSIIDATLERKFGNLNTTDEYFSWATATTGLSKYEVEEHVKSIISRIYDVREPDLFEKLPPLKFDTATNHLGEVNNWLKTQSIANHFNYFVDSETVGVEKPNRQFFEALRNSLDEKSEDILFIDDNLKNIEGAVAAGLKTLYFKSSQVLSEEILKVISSNS